MGNARSSAQCLVAEFQVEIPGILVIKRSSNDKLQYQITIDGFDAELEIIPERGIGSKHKTERHFTYPSDQIRVSVSRSETEAPPSVLITKGIRDYTVQTPYFEARLPEYRRTAVNVLNQVILFFKYKLRHPLLKTIDEHHQDVQNPRWLDEDGNEVGKACQVCILKPVPGIGSKGFGIKKFEKKHDQQLLKALANQVEFRLYEEILSESQASVFNGNLRRAVLELAIACELATKQSLAFDLEDKGRVNVKVLDLITGVAVQAIGQSFKDFDKHAYVDIDHLFRCRNKVAHRGEPKFKDDTGKEYEISEEILQRWWDSAEKLFCWLDSF